MASRKLTERQEQVIRERVIDKLPAINNKVLKWIDDVPLIASRYLVTKTVKGKRYGYCTHCRVTSCLDGENAGKRHNDFGYCPHCESNVMFKDSGRSHSRLIDMAYIVMAQPMRDRGIVIRSFTAVRDYSEGYTDIDTRIIEDYRIYLNKGISRVYKRKRMNWSWDYDWFKQKTVPEPTFLQCWYRKEPVLTHYYGFKDESFKKTNFKYCCIDKYMVEMLKGKYTKRYPVKYLDKYNKHPVLVERLMKEGFEEFVVDKISQSYVTMCTYNWRAQTVSKFFKCDKAEVKRLSGKGLKKIEDYLFIKSFNVGEPESEWLRNQLECDGIFKKDKIRNIARHVSIQKAIKYMKKQNVTIYDYDDYLAQCIELELNLESAFIAFPQDFERAHQQNTDIINARHEEKKMQALREKENKFKDRLKKLIKDYAFEADGLKIRPAERADEIVMEGKTLNHCVGSYADRHLQGTTTIFFIRKKSEPDKPYYTLELAGDCILQCRGMRNCGQTDEIKAFLKKWKDEFERRKLNKNIKQHKVA